MKRFLRLIGIFAIIAAVVYYKPSIHFSNEYKGLYEMPISEMIYIQDIPLKNFSSVDEKEYHEFSMSQLSDNTKTLLDKWLYLHDSIHDSGGLAQLISKKFFKKWEGKIPLFEMDVIEMY